MTSRARYTTHLIPLPTISCRLQNLQLGNRNPWSLKNASAADLNILYIQDNDPYLWHLLLKSFYFSKKRGFTLKWFCTTKFQDVPRLTVSRLPGLNLFLLTQILVLFLHSQRDCPNVTVSTNKVQWGWGSGSSRKSEDGAQLLLVLHWAAHLLDLECFCCPHGPLCHQFQWGPPGRISLGHDLLVCWSSRWLGLMVSSTTFFPWCKDFAAGPIEGMEECLCCAIFGCLKSLLQLTDSMSCILWEQSTVGSKDGVCSHDRDAGASLLNACCLLSLSQRLWILQQAYLVARSRSPLYITLADFIAKI